MCNLCKIAARKTGMRPHSDRPEYFKVADYMVEALLDNKREKLVQPQSTRPAPDASHSGLA